MKTYYIHKQNAIFCVKANNVQDAISKFSSIKDNDLDYLSDEEKQAIEDYKKAIQNTTNLKLLKLYSHILQEEIEHLEELESEN